MISLDIVTESSDRVRSVATMAPSTVLFRLGVRLASDDVVPVVSVVVLISLSADSVVVPAVVSMLVVAMLVVVMLIVWVVVV